MRVAASPARTLPTSRGRSWAPLLLITADLLALELALFLGYWLRLAFDRVFPVEIGLAQYQGLALGVLAIPPTYYLLGLYPGYGLSPVERMRSRFHAAAMVFSVIIAWDYLVQGSQWSRGILLGTALFALIIPTILEEILRHVLGKVGWCTQPVLILGAGKTGRLIMKYMLSSPSLGLHPIAALDDDSAKWDTEIESVPIVGPLTMAPLFQGRTSMVVLAMPTLTRQRTSLLLQELPFPHVVIVPDLFGIQSLWIRTRDFGGVLGLEIQKNLLRPAYFTFKRYLDLALGVPLLIITMPLMALCSLWIKLVSPGPAIFRHAREGRDGKCLQVMKLRTMYPDSEALLTTYLSEHPEERANWERYFKLKRDPRILPGVGRFLRRFSLDELPQLWHVVKGEMSLVGPRPFPGYHLAGFSESFRELRASVTPGLTGLWQVSARSDGDIEVQESLDRYYIQNWSPWLDLHILVHTIRVVVMGRGAY